MASEIECPKIVCPMCGGEIEVQVAEGCECCGTWTEIICRACNMVWNDMGTPLGVPGG